MIQRKCENSKRRGNSIANPIPVQGKKQQITPAANTMKIFFFIPTKACPNPIKADYQRRRRTETAFMVAQKFAEMEEKSGEEFPIFVAMAADGKIWDEDLGKKCSYRDLITHPDPNIRARWLKSGENEFGRLFQGFPPNGDIADGISVLDWIKKTEVPHNKTATYPRYTVTHGPEKIHEQDRTRITCGGDRLNYYGDVTTNTASMETIKMHWNSVISTPGAKYCTGDISNMYLMSMLPDPEYVRFQYDLIPPRIREHYGLDALVVDGYVYARINRAWYGLSQSGKFANDDLVEHLAKFGYVPAGLTDGLFVHKTRDISFTLVVDDFGIKYQRKEDVEHLIKAMREKNTPSKLIMMQNNI